MNRLRCYCMKPALNVVVAVLAANLAACCPAPEGPATGQEDLPSGVTFRKLTSGPLHHFASAYYHIRTFDPSGRRALCLETGITGRNPSEGDSATLGIVDIESGRFEPFASTRAWNFQQGSMQQWLGTAPGSLVTWNDFRDGRFVAVVRNLDSGRERIVDRPLSAVSNDGLRGVSINFARLHLTRPGYGYAGPGQRPRMDEPHPEDDGLFVVDLESGESELIVSLADIHRLNPPPPDEGGPLLWLNHTMFSRDDSRIFFLARSPRRDGRGWLTAAYTVRPDGSRLRCILPYEWGGSHYDWLTGDSLMVTTRYNGRGPHVHCLFADNPRQPGYRVLGAGIIERDGHGRFSRDGRWMVTDTYPDAQRMRTLMLMRMSDQAILPLGRFDDHSETFSGPARCDLHPAFGPDGRSLIFDSVDDGSRQVYLAELR